MYVGINIHRILRINIQIVTIFCYISRCWIASNTPRRLRVAILRLHCKGRNLIRCSYITSSSPVHIVNIMCNIMQLCIWGYWCDSTDKGNSEVKWSLNTITYYRICVSDMCFYSEGDFVRHCSVSSINYHLSLANKVNVTWLWAFYSLFNF